jgi:hypothetical protein
MKLTYEWVNKQIADYKKMIESLVVSEINYEKIKLIWSTTLKALESVKNCMELEMQGYV